MPHYGTSFKVNKVHRDYLTSIEGDCVFRFEDYGHFCNEKAETEYKTRYKCMDCGGHFTFSGPELAKLVIDNCDLMNICRITIIAPKLWKLSLHDYSENEIGEHIKPILEIEAPTLRVIHFCGFGQVCYMETFQSSLVMASIDIPSFCKESRLVANNVINFFQRFAFVQQMKISSNVIEVLAYASNVLDKMPNLYITFLEFGPEPAELKSNPDIVSIMQKEDAF
ncbi:hypothetical protein ACFE04_020059 [Oxalis oulophora]